MREAFRSTLEERIVRKAVPSRIDICLGSAGRQRNSSRYSAVSDSRLLVVARAYDPLLLFR
jgi:hypothetical protein